MSSTGSTAEALTGSIERVTLHNPDSGFAVLRLKVKGRTELVSVVGHLPSAAEGEYVEAQGWWVIDKEHGQQFKATTMRTTPPSSPEGIEKYLGSGFIKGIGPHFAKKLVQDQLPRHQQGRFPRPTANYAHQRREWVSDGGTRSTHRAWS